MTKISCFVKKLLTLLEIFNVEKYERVQDRVIQIRRLTFSPSD